MSDMITWSDMRHATSISRGPGKEKIFNEIHWLPVLKLFIEVYLTKYENLFELILYKKS